MDDVSISEFKAKCLGLIERVHKTRQPLRITRHGRPVAEVIRPDPTASGSSWETWLGPPKSWAISFPQSSTGRHEAYGSTRICTDIGFRELISKRIGKGAARELSNNDNDLWLSPVSVWEALALMQKGRIRVNPWPGSNALLISYEKRR